MLQCTRPSRRNNGRFRFGFTLVEIMVTVVILGVLAGMISVRLRSDIRRRRDLFAVRVEALLETLAFRQTMSQDRIALTWDGPNQTLRLERLFREEGDYEATWQRDLLAQDVVFDDPEIQITEISLDGQPFSSMRDFTRVEMPIDEIRPTIEIDLEWGENLDRIQLLPHEIRPMRFGLGLEPPIESELQPIDLDDAGMGDEDW